MSSNYQQVSEISSIEAWKILSDIADSCLVDVRTIAEWNNIGYPNLSSLSKEVIKISWRLYPNMQINESFLEQIRDYIPNSNSKILFICRSGARSYEAANLMINNGYIDCFNINDGFEGNTKLNFPEATQNGWKASNLPWEQN